MLTQRLNGSTKLNKMTASDILIKGIKRFEGLRLKAYQDAKGVWTIGYGHTAHVKPGDKITVKMYVESLLGFAIEHDRCSELLEYLFSLEQFNNLKYISDINEIVKVHQEGWK